MAQESLSPEEVQSLKDLANPGLSRPPVSDRLKRKFAVLGYGEQKRDGYAITDKGRRLLWDLAGRRSL
jgi:hypothetical protein